MAIQHTLDLAGNRGINAGTGIAGTDLVNVDQLNSAISASTYWTKTGSDIYYTSGNVGVGVVPSAAYTFEVYTSTNAFAQRVRNELSASTSKYGLNVNLSGARGTGANYGTYTAVTSTGSSLNYAGYFNASGASTNYGVYSFSGYNFFGGQTGVGANVDAGVMLNVQSANGVLQAVKGKVGYTSGSSKYAFNAEVTGALGAGVNYGYYSVVSATGGTNNYAGYFSASGATNNYGIYVNSGNSFFGSYTGIGVAPGSAIMLDVQSANGTQQALRAKIGYTSGSSKYATNAEVTGALGAGANHGHYAYVGATGAAINFGNRSIVTGSTGTNTGYKAEVSGTATNHYGGHFVVTGTGTTNYGGYFDASGAAINYGVYSAAGLNYFAGNVGMGILPSSIRLEVAGKIAAKASDGFQIANSNETLIANIYSNSGVLDIKGDGGRSVSISSVTAGEYIRFDGVNGRLGVGITSPSERIEFTGGNIYANVNNGQGIRIGANNAIYRQNANELGFVVNTSERMRLNATGLGIGTTSPEYALDIVSDFMQGGGSLADLTNKSFRFTVRKYNLSDLRPFVPFMGTSTAGANYANIGGGSSLGDAATVINFYTASGITTATGTLQASIDANGALTLNQYTTNEVTPTIDGVAYFDAGSGVLKRADVDDLGTALATSTNYWTLSGSNVYRSTGNVMIGRSSHEYGKLDVEGNMQLGTSSLGYLKGKSSGEMLIGEDAGAFYLFTGFGSGATKNILMGASSGEVKISAGGSYRLNIVGSTGNVGINTDPGSDYKFDVYNNTVLYGFRLKNEYSSSSSKYALYFLSSGARGTGDNYGVYSNVNVSGSTNNFAGYFTASAATNNYAIYSAAGTNYFSGNVGIGTTSPAVATHIQTTNAGVGLRIETTDADSDARIQIKNDAQQWQIGTEGSDSDYLVFRNSTYGADRLKLRTDGVLDLVTYTTNEATPTIDGVAYFESGSGILKRSSLSSLGTALATSTNYWTKTGNDLYYNTGGVSIGKASAPTRTLDIYGASNATVQIEAAAGNAELYFIGTGANQILSDTDLYFTTTAAAKDILFRLNYAEKMRLTATGLGIGTTTPAHKLSVVDVSDGAVSRPLQVWNTGTTIGTGAAIELGKGGIGNNASASLIGENHASASDRLRINIGSITPIDVLTLDHAGAVTLNQYTSNEATPTIDGVAYFDAGSGVLKRASVAAIVSAGSLWTDAGANTYLTSTSDNLIIGASSNPENAKFFVNSTDRNQVARVENTYSSTVPKYSLAAISTGTLGTGANYGTYSYVSATGGTNNYAGYFHAAGATTNYGVYVNSGNSFFGSYTGVGIAPGSAIMLDVQSANGTQQAIRAKIGYTSGSSKYATNAEVTGALGAGANHGHYAYVGATGAAINFGNRSIVTGSTGTNTGYKAEVSGTATNHYGGHFVVSGTGTTNFAGYFDAYNAATNYAVYCPNGFSHFNAGVGIGTTSISGYKLRVYGGESDFNRNDTSAANVLGIRSAGGIRGQFYQNNTELYYFQYTSGGSSSIRLSPDTYNYFIHSTVLGGSTAPTRAIEFQGSTRFKSVVYDINDSSGSSGNVLLRGAGTGPVWGSYDYDDLTNKIWTADTYGATYSGGNIGLGSSSLDDTSLYVYDSVSDSTSNRAIWALRINSGTGTTYGAYIEGRKSNATGSVIGVQAIASTTAGATSLYAIQAQVVASTSGSPTDATGVDIEQPLITTVTLPVAYGVRVQNQATTNVTTGYGILVDDHGSADYNIYSDGASSNNIFEGHSSFGHGTISTVPVWAKDATKAVIFESTSTSNTSRLLNVHANSDEDDAMLSVVTQFETVGSNTYAGVVIGNDQTWRQTNLYTRGYVSMGAGTGTVAGDASEGDEYYRLSEICAGKTGGTNTILRITGPDLTGVFGNNYVIIQIFGSNSTEPVDIKLIWTYSNSTSTITEFAANEYPGDVTISGAVSSQTPYIDLTRSGGNYWSNTSVTVSQHRAIESDDLTELTVTFT